MKNNNDCSNILGSLCFMTRLCISKTYQSLECSNLGAIWTIVWIYMGATVLCFMFRESRQDTWKLPVPNQQWTVGWGEGRAVTWNVRYTVLSFRSCMCLINRGQRGIQLEGTPSWDQLTGRHSWLSPVGSLVHFKSPSSVPTVTHCTVVDCD